MHEYAYGGKSRVGSQTVYRSKLDTAYQPGHWVADNKNIYNQGVQYLKLIGYRTADILDTRRWLLMQLSFRTTPKHGLFEIENRKKLLGWVINTEMIEWASDIVLEKVSKSLRVTK